MLAAGFEGKTEDNEKRLPFLHSCAQDSLHVSISNKSICILLILWDNISKSDKVSKKTAE